MDLPIDSRSVYYLWESGHLVLFFLGCHLFYFIYPQLLGSRFAHQAGILFGIMALSAMILEGLQCLLSGKQLEFTDIISDIAGVSLFLSLHSMRTGRKFFFLHCITFFLVSAVLWPIVSSFADEILTKYQFPVLADFETPFEATRFEGKTGAVALAEDHAFSGKRSLKISFFPGQWSGVTYEYLSSDWHSYSQLHFAVYNPGLSPVSLEILIHDVLYRKMHLPLNDLYSRMISLPAGEWTVVQIPLAEVQSAPQDRQMDLTQISGLGFFVEGEIHPLTLYLDSIKLE